MTEMTLLDPPCRVRVRTRSNARGFTLRLHAYGDGAVLTQPRGVTSTETRAFLLSQLDWLRAAMARRPGKLAVGHGVCLPVDGAEVVVFVESARRRAPQLEDGRLLVGGSGTPGLQIAQWLQLRARDRMVPAARKYAAALGKQVARIAFRDTRSRWGSCSSRGSLSFSWRLAMAPAGVQDYVAAHEAAHLREMNHSERFWSLVNDLVPDWKSRRAWLQSHGQHLHAYRFDIDASDGPPDPS